MKLYYDKRAKDPIYYIQQGYRNGKKTTTKNVARIGKHSELLKITDDPLVYAKEQVAKYNEEAKSGIANMEVTIDFNEKIKSSEALVSTSNQLNIGYFYLQEIYHQLNVGEFFKQAASNMKITFDPNLINRFLVHSRILNPASKLSTHGHLNKFYEQPEFEYTQIMKTMDIVEKNFDEYICHLFENSNKIIHRDTSVCYFDCTNYYFEIEEEDENYIDEVTGETVKGLRKYAVSKEHRPNPIVEMGLFVDAKGIPLSMCIAPGSDSEQTQAIPLEEKLTKMFQDKKFIYCADAGLGSFDIRKFNSMGGRAFVVTQSVKKLSDVMKQAVFNDYDYRLLSNDRPVSLEALKTFDKNNEANLPLYQDKAYKIIIADRAVDTGLYEEKKYKNGKTKMVKAKGLLKQKIIITFSRKMMEYQRAIRNRQIERAKKLLKNIDLSTYKKGPHDVTRFIKRKSVSRSNDPAADKYYLDLSVIEEEKKYDGFYAVATNLDDDAATILSINAQRYKIEDCFRVMKTNFSARPVYHQLRKRIIAHFAICYTALLVLRILEARLNTYEKHYTTANIIETLQNMEVTNVKDMYYMATYNGSQICTSLNNLSPFNLDKKYYTPKELNKKFKKISK